MTMTEDIIQQGHYTLEVNQSVGIGSHLQAGARAELIDSPLTEALASRRGKMLARSMRYLFRGDIEGLLNYAAIRPYAIAEAIRQTLGDSTTGKTILDPASGFGPEFYWLAEDYPQCNWVEVDMHEVIEFKRSAYYQFGIPDNLRLRPIDLRKQYLHTVIKKLVDVVVVLGAYVKHDNFKHMLGYISYLIPSDGYLIAPFPYKPGIDNFTDNSFVFANIVSTPKGVVNSENDISRIFVDTDFDLHSIIKLSDYAQQVSKPDPADIEIIAIARRR